MNNKTQKYILSIPGEIAINYSIKIEKTLVRRGTKAYAEKVFDNLDDVLQTIVEIAKNKSIIMIDFNLDISEFTNAFLEDNVNNAYLILKMYFEMFETDFICKKNWDLFLLIFNIESPATRAQYNIESSNDNYKDIDMNSFLSKCIDKNGIKEKELKKTAELFLDDRNELINISFDYICYSTREVMVAIVNHIFNCKENAIIKICENCGKLFIPQKADTKYCDRVSSDHKNKTCKQVMDLRKKKESLKDPIKRLYKNVYNSLYNSYSYSRSKENKELFDEFVKENKLKNSEYKEGIISTDEYESWLKSFYKRK